MREANDSNELLDVFSFCTSVSLMIAKGLFAFVDDLVSIRVYHDFRVTVVVAIYTHGSVYPLLQLMEETVSSLLFEKWSPCISMPRLKAKRTSSLRRAL